MLERAGLDASLDHERHDGAHDGDDREGTGQRGEPRPDAQAQTQSSVVLSVDSPDSLSAAASTALNRMARPSVPLSG